jgi:GTP-binding protein
MLPVVVIAGRPNVGKSTLFNRLAGRREALVAPQAGVTRDAKEAEALLRGRRVRLVDTAGLEEAAPESLSGRMREGAAAAIGRADLVLFVTDARAGITPADRHFAAWLRRQGRPLLPVVNKAEGRGGADAALEAFSLGLGDPVAVSAEHGEGLADLMSEIAARLPPDAEDASLAADEVPAMKLAIIGRPNTGKSTLLNRLVGEARMLTGPEAGLTRDAVTVRLRGDDGAPIELVDTPGLRRRARIEAELERLSVSAAIGALKLAEVVVLVLDAAAGVHDQDLQLARLVEREGRALVLALNKWDAVAARNDTRRAIGERLAASFAQLPGVAVVPLSAMTGAGVEKLLPAVRHAYGSWNTRVPTGELNRWFAAVLERHPPPLEKGRRLKLRYITQAKARPPTFIAFGTRATEMPEDYRRYLVNALRETFGLAGVPIRLQFRGTKNPYAE